MSTVDHARPSADHLENRLDFETLLADLSSRFINLPPGEVDREIQDALRRVCEFFDIDLALLWQWSDPDPDVVTPTHVHCITEDLQPPEPIRQEHYPYHVRQVLAGRTVRSSSTDDLPAEAAVDVEYARLLGIKSNLCLPLAVGGLPPVGALAFNTLRVQCEWSDPLVKRLQLVAQVFTHALARKRAEQVLRENEEVSRATFDQAAVGIAHVGTDGRWLRVNDKLCAIVGYSREELLQLTFQDITHPDDLEVDLGYMRQVLSGRIETYSIEKRYVRKDRSLVWINLTVSLVRTAAGEPRHFISVVEDITDRKRAEEALRRSEARLMTGAELAGLAFYEVDFDHRTTFLDDRVRAIWGVPPEREHGLEPGKFWMEHLHPDDRQRVSGLRDQLNGGRLEQLSIEYRFLHPTSGEKWIEHLARVGRRDTTGQALQTFGVFRDITDRKRVEDDLRDLSRRLIQAHEEERALLARELHDDVTQRLAVLAIEVGRAESAAAGGPQSQAMRVLREELVRLSEDVHSLAYQLHPSVLDELGLAEALRTECERRGRRSRFQLSMNFDPLPSVLGRDAALCLFRVAQEALNNATRHSGARGVSVTLRQMDGGLLLAVHDDGVGFDPERRRKGGHLGLASMRERVRLVNGTLDIESTPGRGTTVVAWVPGEGGLA